MDPFDQLSCVYVVDDDQGVREALLRTFRHRGFRCAAFADGNAFLAAFSAETAGCLILDIRMPGMDGLHLHEEIRAIQPDFPVIFLTGHATVATAVRSLRGGAHHFLEKPVEPDILIEEVREALAVDHRHRIAAQARQSIEEKLRTLSPRELEVLDLLVNGMQTAEIARELSIVTGTVKLHRAHIMKKMGISSASQLVGMILQAGITSVLTLSDRSADDFDDRPDMAASAADAER